MRATVPIRVKKLLLFLTLTLFDTVVMDTEIQSKQGKSQKEKPIKQELMKTFLPTYF